MTLIMSVIVKKLIIQKWYRNDSNAIANDKNANSDDGDEDDNDDIKDNNNNSSSNEW